MSGFCYFLKLCTPGNIVAVMIIDDEINIKLFSDVMNGV